MNVAALKMITKLLCLVPQLDLIRSITWVERDRMRKEEVPFKSIKITLSEEALARLNSIVKQASFRSYSSGIEECIRAVYDIVQEFYSVVGTPDDPMISPSEEDEVESFKRIGMRMSRFTRRALTAK